MEKNFVDKLYGNMNYNTYNTIQSISGKASIGLIVAKNLLLNNYPIAPDVAYALAGILCVYYAGNNILKAETHTKDVTEIKQMYDEIVVNYNKLNDQLGLESPVEIYSMFNYMLYEGYLSKDKSFEFSKANARDIKTIAGANVVNGEAVCRHIARMLTDILNNKGIESCVLPVYTRTPVITIHTDGTTEKQTIEQMYDFVRTHLTDDGMRKTFNEVIAQAGEKIDGFSYGYEDDKGLGITRAFGNHAVTLASQNGKDYFLDSTQTRIYKLSPNDNGILVDNEDDGIKIKYGSIGLFNRAKDLKTIKSKVAQPSTSLEEDLLVAETTRELCKNNLDMLEQFYNENNELYSELSNKFMTLKQQNRLIKRIAK